MTVVSMQIMEQIRTPLLEKIKTLSIDNEALLRRSNNATLEIERIDEALGKAMFVLRNLFTACPSGVRCDHFHHSKKDQHGADEECGPCCKYYKAIYEASELLK